MVVKNEQSPAESVLMDSPNGAPFYLGGSPYSTAMRPDADPAPSAVLGGVGVGYGAGLMGWSGSSDSSQQLYRHSSASLGGSSREKDKKQVCSALLITTAALVVMAVLAIAAVAAYLGGRSFFPPFLDFWFGFFLVFFFGSFYVCLFQKWYDGIQNQSLYSRKYIEVNDVTDAGSLITP